MLNCHHIAINEKMFFVTCDVSLTWNELFISRDVLRVEEVGGQVQPRLRPLDVKVEGEGDAVVLVVDL